jgi:hypothetical protein
MAVSYHKRFSSFYDFILGINTNLINYRQHAAQIPSIILIPKLLEETLHNIMFYQESISIIVHH